MNKSILTLPFVLLLLIANVNAFISVTNGFTDGGKTQEKADGESAKFWASVWSNTGNGSVDVSLRSLDGKLIYSFEDNLKFTDVFEKEYSIDKNLYKNPGEYQLLIYAKDSDSDVLKDDLRLIVKEKNTGVEPQPEPTPTPTNHAPSFIIKHNGVVVNYDVAVTEGEEVVLVLEGSDEDGDKLNYNYVDFIPSGSSLIGNIFSWTPAKSDSGRAVKFKVNDGKIDSFTKSVRILVNAKPKPEEPPVVTDGAVRGDFNFDGKVDIADFWIFAGNAFGTKKGDANYDANADLDNDGDVDLDDFFAFALNFGKETGLKLRVIDKKGNEVDKLNVKENERFILSVDARDNDGNELPFTIESNTANIYGTGKLIVGESNYNTVAHPDRVGNFSVKLTISDGVNKLERRLSVNIDDVNRNPSIVNVERTPGGFVLEGQVIKLKIDANDADGDSLTYSVNRGNFVQDGNVLTWKTGFTDAGSYDLTLTASDGFGGSGSRSLSSFNILDNKPIVFTSSPVTEFVLDKIGKEYRYDVNSNRDNGPIGGYPIYSLLEAPSGMNINSGSGLITWKPNAAQDGNYNVKINMRDEHGVEAVQEFTLKVVKPSNQSPSLVVKKNGVVVGSASINENSKLVLDLEVSDADADLFPGAVGLRLSGEPNGMKIVGNQIVYDLAGNYNVVAHPKTSESFSFDIVVSDGLDKREVRFAVVVNDVNRLPILTVPEQKFRLTEGTNLGSELKGNVLQFNVMNESDLDGDNVSVSVDNMPKGASLIDGNFIWKIRKNQGTIFDAAQAEVPYVLKFRLSDGFGVVEGSVNVFIVDNLVPFYPADFGKDTAPLAVLNVKRMESVGGGTRVFVTADNSKDNQNFNHDLEYRYIWGDGSRSEFKKNADASTTEHTYTKDGNVRIELEVRDEDGMIGKAYVDLDLKVLRITDSSVPGPGPSPPVTPPGAGAGVNNAPVVGDIPNQNVVAGALFNTINLNSFVSDADNDAISWSASGNVLLSVNLVNGIATISYPNGFLGSETLVFTASDGKGGVDSDNAIFTVSSVPVNNNPVLTVKRNGVAVGNTLTLNEGESLSLALEGSDADGDNLRFEVSNNPAGSVLSGGVFSWIPSNAQGGQNYIITFRVFDLNSNGQLKGGSNSKVITINVNDNLEPLFKKAKVSVHNLNVKNIIVNNWETVRKGELFEIDIVVENKGNVKENDAKVTLEIPQLDYYERSNEFDLKKKRTNVIGFSAVVPEELNDEIVYAIVTVSSDKDEVREVIGFLVE